jgi:hypothetical protein
MPTHFHESELLGRLQPLVAGHRSGQAVVAGDHGGVVVQRRGHVRGIWRCMNGVYGWTPAGYGEPTHKAADLDAAVYYTTTIILAA